MRSQKARETAWTGMLFALAIALSYLESLVSPLLGLMPAIKLGLSNIVVMYALLFLRTRTALLLVVLKALFAFLTRGATAGFLSLCGGALSLAVMLVLLQLPVSGYIFCAGSALAHNLGQLAGAAVLLSSAMALGYAPVLLAAGLIVGGISCILSRALFAALPKQTGSSAGEPVSKIRIFLKIFILPIDIYAYMPYNKAIDTGMCPMSNYKITGGNSYD